MAITNLQELFDHVIHRDPEESQGLKGVVLFDLSGENGGKWTVTFGDGQPQLEEGETASPDVTFSVDEEDLIAIANGELNPINAFMQGRVKVKGDMSLAMRFQNILA